MSEEIIVACPECDTKFYAPIEYSGGAVDCTECGTCFEIVALPGNAAKNLGDGEIPYIEIDDTIVMSRSDIGMISNVRDIKLE